MLRFKNSFCVIIIIINSINYSNIFESVERSFIYVFIRVHENRSMCIYAVYMISVTLENFARLDTIYLIIDIMINLRIIESLTGNKEEKQNFTISNTLMFCIVMKNDGLLFIDFAKKSFIYQSLCNTETDSFILENCENFSLVFSLDFSLVNIAYRMTI